MRLGQDRLSLVRTNNQKLRQTERMQVSLKWEICNTNKLIVAIRIILTGERLISNGRDVDERSKYRTVFTFSQAGNL